MSLCIRDRMVCSILVYSAAGYPTSGPHDLERLPIRWRNCSHYPMGLLKQCPALATIALNTCRLQGRMGLCFRCPYERILPVLSIALYCSAVSCRHHPQEQVDMPLYIQYLVFGSVRAVRIWRIPRAKRPAVPDPHRGSTRSFTAVVHRLHSVVIGLQCR